MKTKAFFTLVFLFFIANAVLYGQKSTENRVKEKVSNVVEKMDQSFKFEKTKRSAIEEIFTDFYTGQQKLKSNIQGPASGLRQGLVQQDFQSVRKKNEALINERESRLKKELTEEEYKKWCDEIEPQLHTKRKKK